MLSKLKPFLFIAIVYIIFTKFISPVAVKRASRPRRKDTSMERMVNMYSKVKMTNYKYATKPKKKDKNKPEKDGNVFNRIYRKAKEYRKNVKNK